MKQILILLTKHSDWTSRLIYRICGHGYTHSSISLENAPEHFFSFNHRGFAEEILAKHRRRGVQRSRCYHLQVSDEAYHAIESRIQWFLAHRSCFRYSVSARFAVCCASPSSARTNTSAPSLSRNGSCTPSHEARICSCRTTSWSCWTTVHTALKMRKMSSDA